MLLNELIKNYYGLAILLECNMIYQHPKPTISIIQDKDQKDDQEKDGLTVSKKYAPSRIKESETQLS
jgi:hypothetical protein